MTAEIKRILFLMMKRTSSSMFVKVAHDIQNLNYDETDDFSMAVMP
jgi:hypothetical protein